jgi:hypothetical protein
MGAWSSELSELKTEKQQGTYICNCALVKRPMEESVHAAKALAPWEKKHARFE